MLLGLQALTPSGDERLGLWWLRQRDRLTSEGRPTFDTLFMLVAWTLWKERNNRAFHRASASLQQIVDAARREADDWIEAGYSTIAELPNLWSRNSVIM
jgi:hypothetical protein